MFMLELNHCKNNCCLLLQCWESPELGVLFRPKVNLGDALEVPVLPPSAVRRSLAQQEGG